MFFAKLMTFSAIISLYILSSSCPHPPPPALHSLHWYKLAKNNLLQCGTRGVLPLTGQGRPLPHYNCYLIIPILPSMITGKLVLSLSYQDQQTLEAAACTRHLFSIINPWFLPLLLVTLSYPPCYLLATLSIYSIVG